MNLKSKDNLVKLGEGSEFVISIKKHPPLDFSQAQALPDIKHVLSRRWTLLSEFPANMQDRQTLVNKKLAYELYYDWIMINVPPINIKNIIKRLDKLFKHVDKLHKTSNTKRGASWKKEMEELLEDLNNGFDIRSFHEASHSQIELDEFEIEVGSEEEALYIDNCIPVPGTKKCARKIFCAGVDPDWRRKAHKRQEALEKSEEYASRKAERIQAEKEALERSKASEPKSTTGEKFEDDIHSSGLERQDSGEMFKVSSKVEPSRVVKNMNQPQSASTRSSTHQPTSMSSINPFPQKPVRTSLKDIDNTIVEVMVNMESRFSVEQRRVAPLLAYIMNSLAGQSWEAPTEESESDLNESESEIEADQKRKRKETRDLTFVLPSRRTLRKKLEDAALLNFKYVAQTIQSTSAKGGTVTAGWDDTIKSAGHRVHDAKTGRVTCTTSEVDEQGKMKKVRQSFTTGFTANISHKGEDSAVSVQSVLAQMAVLCNVKFEEMFDFLDFFMNDRAGDSDTMLDSLGVSDDQRLKCNAHPLLCVQNCVDKTFKDKETEIGVSKLISTDAAHVFNSPKSSIFTLGLIAFAKFLSPSHAQESVSLYTQYKQFLKTDSEDNSSETREVSANLLKHGFQKFSSNRFGRLLSLAEIFVENKPMIVKFYEEQVDQHANKLFLACYSYLNSSWFNLCCEIGSGFYKSTILPIKAALGIDEFRSQSSEYRSWKGMKRFYSELLDELSIAKVKTHKMTGSELLKASVAENILNGLKHQLDYMKFFKDESVPQKILDKIDESPLTNSGCESNFAHLDLECRRGSGQTKLQTMSDRHIVKGNNYFDTDEWKSMCPELKAKEWKYARSSREAKIVQNMKQEFIEKVKSAESLANKEKIRKKQLKNEKCLKQLELVKMHGGPVTPNEVEKLDTLTGEEILREVRYLRQTVAPNIREKRKVGNKFIKFSRDELVGQVLNVLKPENESVEDIEQLLLTVYDKNESTDSDTSEENKNVGKVAIVEGPFGEKKVALVVDSQTVQLYHVTRYGFEPDEVT